MPKIYIGEKPTTSKMVLGNYVSTKRREKLDPYLSLFAKVNSNESKPSILIYLFLNLYMKIQKNKNKKFNFNKNTLM